MWLIFILLTAFIGIAYIFVIKPYLTIQSLKRQFQAKGFKVLVQKLDFTADTITSAIQYDTLHYKDSEHRFKNDWKNYDITIKNSFFAVFVSLNSIQLVKQAYKKIEYLQKPSMLRNNFLRFYGGGLIFAQGDLWKSKRKLYSEIFNFKLLEQLHPLVQKTIDNSMKEWKLNQKIDLLNQFRTMFFNTFVTCYFGKQFNQFSYKNQSYGKAISTSFQELLYQGVSLRHMLFGTKFLQKGYLKEDRQIEQRVSAIKIQTKQFVQKRWKDIQNNEGQNSHSILSKIVFNESFRNLDEQQKQKALQSFTGDLIMFFFASTDTTSASLAATLHILNKYPEVTKRLIEQLNQSPDDYKHSTIKSWKYMDAVLNQILRLYGPFNWIIVRQFISNGYTLGGVNIPKDVIIAIQSQTIHCQQKYYQNPYDFNPDRFLGQKSQQPYSFVAFGGGLRNCIGQYLAKIQYKMALAKFLRSFDFKTEDQLVLSLTSIYLSQNNNFVLQKIKN